MFGRALKMIRQYHRLSQADLAHQLCISRSYINEIERKKKEPSLDILKKYAERFEIPLSSLLLFAENGEQNTYDKARVFVADKVLRMLEWVADGSKDEQEEKLSIHSN